jgi:nitrate reductase NapAB chaperone NapD
MFKKLKKFFHNPDKETIHIFEEKSKINYEPTLFSSLEVLSLTYSKLTYLKPLSVFTNLKILNLSNNTIQDIAPLKDLTKLKIVDLRFNKIKSLPLWVFKLNKTLYWERSDEEQEGIFLEGNPLDKKLIDKIKKYPTKKLLSHIIVKEQRKDSSTTMEVEQLIPLRRQGVSLFIPKSFSSNFINTFNFSKPSETEENQLKLNKVTIEYDENASIIHHTKIQELQYIILILNETECCLNPPILETLSQYYKSSKIFLIIENRKQKTIQEKITFFKTYNNSINIIEIYHSFDQQSNEFIKKEIYNYLRKTQEANTLWRKNWIRLRDEIEESIESNISHEKFQSLAKKHDISSDLIDDIFIYLKRVGSIKENIKPIPISN